MRGAGGGWEGVGTRVEGGGGGAKQSEGLGGVLWVYKIDLKWPVIAMAITRKPQPFCLSRTWAQKIYFTKLVLAKLLMSKYNITGIICIHIGMNEWVKLVKLVTWEFPHKT